MNNAITEATELLNMARMRSRDSTEQAEIGKELDELQLLIMNKNVASNQIHQLEDLILHERYDEAARFIGSISSTISNLPADLRTEFDNKQTVVIQRLSAKIDQLMRESESVGNDISRTHLPWKRNNLAERKNQIEDELKNTREILQQATMSFSEPDDTVPTNSISSDKVSFSAYNPRKVVKNKRYSVVIYAYREREERDLIQADIGKFEPEIGEQPKERKAQNVISIQRKTAIEVVPECDGIDFEPRSLTKTWDGEWIRYNFDLKVPKHFQEDELWLRISIRIKGLEVAHIKSSCEIMSEETSLVEPPKIPDNPLAQALERDNLTQHKAKPYRNIFISYSRKDQEFALQRATEIERILGDKVFLDVDSMRAGDDWELELAKAIRDADIFHLLWSESSANSKWCRYEWDYALNHKCLDNRCVGVIRPVYWSKPMPDPPEELSHLHFEFIEPPEEKTE